MKNIHLTLLVCLLLVVASCASSHRYVRYGKVNKNGKEYALVDKSDAKKMKKKFR